MANRILRTKATLRRFTSDSQPIPTLSNPRPRFISTKLISPNQSQYRKCISLANLLQRYGFPPSQFQSFLSRNRFLLNFNLHDIERSLGILLSLKIPQKTIVSLVIDCPGVLEFEFLKKWQIGFSKSEDFGVSPLMFKSILEHSIRFQIDPDGFNKIVRVLRGLGFSEGTVRKVLEVCPKVITMKEREIRSRIEFLMGMGFPRDGIDWFFYSFPEFLGFGFQNRLMSLLDEFEDLGFSKELIRKEIIRKPQILCMEVGEPSKCLDLLRTLKCREPIKLKIFSEGAFRAGFEVKLRVDCLCKHGLIRREAFKVLWKEPRVIIYDIEDIEKKIEFLANTMGFDTSCLVDVPEYLGVSFEKQIVPRYSVIEYLRAKGGLGDQVGLKDMIKLSRVRFYNLYVKPYPDCQKMFGRFSGDVQVSRQHPVGLWKLFKAQRPAESKEDVKHLKSFMEALVYGED